MVKMAVVVNKMKSENNELLCYLQNYYGNSSKASLTTTLNGFYTQEEISSAKALLFQTAEQLQTVNGGKLHRLVTRKGDNKKAADVDDIISLFADLDVNKVELPRFMAGDLRRIPPFVPDATDICALTLSVGIIQSQLADLQSRFSMFATTAAPVTVVPHTTAVTDGSSDPTRVSSGTAGSFDSAGFSGVTSHSLHLCSSVADVQDQSSDSGPSTSWADMAESAKNNPNEWIIQKKSKKPQIRVKGAKTSDAEVKAVPRKSILAAYVGRMHIDTTADALSKYLSDQGMRGVVCRKLRPKDGQTFKTAAFFVSCCEESRHLFYDENCWPEGVELRDWVFHRN